MVEIKSCASKDEGCKEHMRMVIEASRDGAIVKKHGGPFGAGVVKNGKVISVAHNTVLRDKDSTCHAEVNAIRLAGKILKTTNLSQCELYSSCEPCPMCWGAIQRAKIRKVYVGIGREIPKRYGFDDSKFYDDIHFLNQNKKNKNSASHNKENTLKFYCGILPNEECCSFLERCASLNWKLYAGGSFIKKLLEKSLIVEKETEEMNTTVDEKHINVLKDEIRNILEKHEEKKQILNGNLFPFGAVIMKDGILIAECHDIEDEFDATNTVEVTAIRKACKNLGTYNLQGCCMYTIIQPDVLSTAAAMWARIDCIYAGIHSEMAACYGYIYPFLQFKELEFKEERVTKIVYFSMTDEAEKVFKEWQENLGLIY